MPRGGDAEWHIRCLAVTGVATSTDAGLRERCRPADRNPESNIQDCLAGYRWEQANEIPELRLSVQLQLYFSFTGLFQPELHGEISAPRDRRHSRAGL